MSRFGKGVAERLRGIVTSLNGLTGNITLTSTDGTIDITPSGQTIDIGVTGSAGVVTDVSNSDGTLTISPNTGSVVASLNLANSNTWTTPQSFPGNIAMSGGQISGASSVEATVFYGGTYYTSLTEGSVPFVYQSLKELYESNFYFNYDLSNERLQLGKPDNTVSSNTALWISGEQRMIRGTAQGGSGQNNPDYGWFIQPGDAGDGRPWVALGTRDLGDDGPTLYVRGGQVGVGGLPTSFLSVFGNSGCSAHTGVTELFGVHYPSLTGVSESGLTNLAIPGSLILSGAASDFGASNPSLVFTDTTGLGYASITYYDGDGALIYGAGYHTYNGYVGLNGTSNPAAPLQNTANTGSIVEVFRLENQSGTHGQGSRIAWTQFGTRVGSVDNYFDPTLTQWKMRLDNASGNITLASAGTDVFFMKGSQIGLGTQPIGDTARLRVVNSSNSDQDIATFLAANETLGVQIWYGGIRATGSATNASLYLEGKGTGAVGAATLTINTTRLAYNGATSKMAVAGDKSFLYPTGLENQICFADSTAQTAGVGGGISFAGLYITGDAGSFATSGVIHTSKQNSTSGNFAYNMIFVNRDNGGVGVEGMRLVPGNSGGTGVYAGFSGITAPVAFVETPANTTSSCVKAGAFEIQSFAVNNGWLGDNVYYTTGDANFHYRANGYAAILRFITGGFTFETAPSGTAAAVATMTTRFGVSNTGEVTLGGGINYPYVAKTSNYTLTSSDYTVNAASGTFAFTLPTAVGNTRIYNMKNSGAGTITINTTSSQTIDGLASGTITLATGDNLTVQSNGANWIIL